MKKVFIDFIGRKLLYFVFRDDCIRLGYSDHLCLSENDKVFTNVATTKVISTYCSYKITVHLRTAETKQPILMFSHILLSYHSCINTQQLLVNG
jgi:hypothetical protein